MLNYTLNFLINYPVSVHTPTPTRVFQVLKPTHYIILTNSLETKSKITLKKKFQNCPNPKSNFQ